MSSGTFVLIVIVVLSIVLGYFTVRHDSRDRLLNRVNDERHIEKERRKRMLLKHLKNKGKITNNEVEKLLGITHSTATRYFDELQEIGIIIERGDGNGTYYELAIDASKK